MVKFEDLEFRGKQRVKYDAVNEIMDILDHNLVIGRLSYLSVLRYLEVLVDGQDYDPKTHVFYDDVTHKKLNYNFLASIAKDYIMDNIPDFEKD